MGSLGYAVVDFGAFPGVLEQTVTVTGQAAIAAVSSVEAWLYANAVGGDFTDHSLDEHIAEMGSFRVFAHSVVVATGFSIRMKYERRIQEPLEMVGARRSAAINGVNSFSLQPTIFPSVGGTPVRIHGKWNVAWVWI